VASRKSIIAREGNMRRKWKFVILVALLLLCSFVFAREVKISGIVIDDKLNEPLPGANVFIKNTLVGTASDNNGRFFLRFETDRNFTLVVSFIGYVDYEMECTPDRDYRNLEIRLKEDVFRGKEVVVTGIASKRAKEVAEVAVSHVKVGELTSLTNYQGFSQLVTGKVAGVKIETATGNVGGGFRFFVRSGGGLNGNEQPIIYVDGIRVTNVEYVGYGVGGQGFSTLADLNPEDIESIDFLKGPAAAAIYGTDASNGVVIITTKRGTIAPGAGKAVRVDYKYVTGWNEQSYKYTEDDFLTYKTINSIFRKGALRQHTLSINGGTGLMKYYVSVDDRDEEGILPNNWMKRQSIRGNLDVFPSEKMTVRLSSGFVLNKNRRPYNDNNIFGALGNTILTNIPWAFTDSAAVFALENLVRSNRYFGSVQMDYKPITNLEIFASIGIDNGNLREDNTFPYGYGYAFYPKGARYIEYYNYTNMTYTFNVQYNYKLGSNLSAYSRVGAQLFERKVRDFWIEKQDYLTALITNIGAGESFNFADETYSHLREAGIFTEHSINYRNTFLATFMLRRDYASVLGLKSPNIYYPGASFAVRLDQFGFVPESFDLLKLRVAYGESGQLPGLLDGIPLLWTAEPSGYGAGAVLSAIGNEKIKPERIKELETGIEVEYKDFASLELNYYTTKAVNSIIDFRNAPSTGKTASAVPFNVGRADGKGIETVLGLRLWRTRNSQFDINMTYAYQENEVKDLGGAQPIYDPFDINVIKVGLPKHAFYKEKVLGAKFDDKGKYIGPEVTEDRVYLGCPIPKHTGSISSNLRILRNLRLYVMADWAKDLKVFNNTKLFAIYLGSAWGIGSNVKEYNDLEDKLGIRDWDGDPTDTLAWGTPEYKEAAEKYAKMDYNYDANFVEDADYFKLRELGVSYDFKDILPRNMGIANLVVGFSARNILMITKYSGADPEVNFDGARSLVRGQDFLTLQNPRTYNFWIRIVF